MMPACGLRHGESGFTLVEVMIAVFVLLVGMAGSAALIDGANSTTNSTKAREAANALGREIVEDARAIPYHQLGDALLVSALQGKPGLADSEPSSGGWTIERRGVVYTISADVCSVDDPQDRLGPRTGGGFCDAGAGGTVDADPEDYKRVTVIVAWTARGQQRTARQTGIVGNPGNGAGVAIESFAPTSGAVRDERNDWLVTGGSVTFAVTTSRDARDVEWWVDGNARPAVTPSGLNASFTWTLTDDLKDGVYTVGTQAHDRFGRSAGSRALSMVVDRRPPPAPVGFRAGRNGAYVDLLWEATAEGDVVGYTVARQDGTTWVDVCVRTTVTSCRDAPPDGAGTRYRLIAHDRTRDSSPVYADVGAPPADNRPPYAPSDLQGTPLSVNSARLSWTKSAGDPDRGDSVAFYRVYRDGQPYDTTIDVSYTDSATGGASHTYSVTAVDTRFAESSPAGPVTVLGGYTP